jgi:phage N-6-adenine-methyltransferase
MGLQVEYRKGNLGMSFMVGDSPYKIEGGAGITIGDVVPSSILWDYVPGIGSAVISSGHALKIEGSPIHGMASSGTLVSDEQREKSDIEWYTPDWIIDAARRTLGVIDLDPATTAEVNKRIKATNIYTKEDDGLTKPWFGSVWLNPPYRRDLITPFIDKFCAEYDGGKITQALVLVNSSTETFWFQRLLERCSMLLLFHSRIAFMRESGKWKKPMQGQTLFYFGKEEKAFITNFKPHGSILFPSSWIES